MSLKQQREHRLRDIRGKAQVIELDRPRKLMLTTLAWEQFELVYDSRAAALAGWAEIIQGKRQTYHVVRWLWALLQEELHQANTQRDYDKQEEISLDDVRTMFDDTKLSYYISKISDTITAYYPLQDPQKTATKTESPGTGGGPGNSSTPSTGGPGSDS